MRPKTLRAIFVSIPRLREERVLTHMTEYLTASSYPCRPFSRFGRIAPVTARDAGPSLPVLVVIDFLRQSGRVDPHLRAPALRDNLRRCIPTCPAS